MTVKDLIDRLAALPPELTVIYVDHMHGDQIISDATATTDYRGVAVVELQ